MSDEAPQCLAVMYHYVRDRSDSPTDKIAGLSVEAFERQLDMLSQRFEPIGWSDWWAHATQGKPAPAQSFMVTFDDGLKDHVEIVAPLLKARGMSGVFFASCRPAEEARMESAHMTHLLLCHLPDEAFEQAVRDWLDQHARGENWLERVDSTQAQRVYHYEPPSRAAFKYLLTVVLPVDLRERMLSELFAEHVGSQADWAKRWYASWADWRAVIAQGHTVGGHGYVHEPYARFSATEQFADLQRGAQMLDARLSVTQSPMSYPFGSFDDVTATAVERAGYAAGFTTIEGCNTAQTNRVQLHRVDTIAVDTFLSRSDCQAVAGS